MFSCVVWKAIAPAILCTPGASDLSIAVSMEATPVRPPAERAAITIVPTISSSVTSDGAKSGLLLLSFDKTIVVPMEPLEDVRTNVDDGPCAV